MLIPESWLRSFFGSNISLDELTYSLMMSGMEVEKVEPVSAVFSGVIIAYVQSVSSHPDADKLKLCQVDCGSHGNFTIVCGADNVRPGIFVPCALIGAHLPGGLKIKKTKLRGQISEGMLCSSEELGCRMCDDSSHHNGLWELPSGLFKPGEDLIQAMKLDDMQLEIKLTPNRGDCLSVYGLARDISAFFDEESLSKRDFDQNQVSSSLLPKINIVDKESCPHYCGCVIESVNTEAPLPFWIKQRLLRSEVNLVSTIVDITNYVMLELGQPLHAFDYDVISSGTVIVRKAQEKDSFTLLNDQTINPTGLLITDIEKPLALAGIMGGRDSAVRPGKTKNIFLESAFFTPKSIIQQASSLSLDTDASYRYARGVDFHLQREALERAVQLILDICGGNSSDIVEVSSEEHLPKRDFICLHLEKVHDLLGFSISVEEMQTFLEKIGCQVAFQGDFLKVLPPSFRFDISEEVDLIEELVRLKGYDSVPEIPPVASFSVQPQQFSKQKFSAASLRKTLSTLGFQEVINFSFVSASLEKDFCNNPHPLTLANPINVEQSVMRSCLLGSLINSFLINRRRQMDRVKIFEIGRCFDAAQIDEDLEGSQPMKLGVLASGLMWPEQWFGNKTVIGFHDLKKILENLLMPLKLSFEPYQDSAFHSGRCAKIIADNEEVGILGQVHPKWVSKYDLGASPIIGEINLDMLLGKGFPIWKEISRFPRVVRDLAWIVAEDITWKEFESCLWGNSNELVQEIRLFDLYKNKDLMPNQKSFAVRVTLQDNTATLTEQKIEGSVALLVASIKNKFSADLRS